MCRWRWALQPGTTQPPSRCSTTTRRRGDTTRGASSEADAAVGMRQPAAHLRVTAQLVADRRREAGAEMAVAGPVVFEMDVDQVSIRRRSTLTSGRIGEIQPVTTQPQQRVDVADPRGRSSGIAVAAVAVVVLAVAGSVDRRLDERTTLRAQPDVQLPRPTLTGAVAHPLRRLRRRGWIRRGHIGRRIDSHRIDGSRVVGWWCVVGGVAVGVDRWEEGQGLAQLADGHRLGERRRITIVERPHPGPRDLHHLILRHGPGSELRPHRRQHIQRPCHRHQPLRVPERHPAAQDDPQLQRMEPELTPQLREHRPRRRARPAERSPPPSPPPIHRPDDRSP